MIVSTLQSIRCFCEHRGEDGPADAWQRIEDRHVTMLLPLPRHVLPIITGNGFGELLAEPAELYFRIGQLAIDESQSLNGHSDMCSRSLNGSLSHAKRRLAQLAQHLGCVETTYTVLLQNTLNSCFRCTGRPPGASVRPPTDRAANPQPGRRAPASADSSARADLANGWQDGRALP